MKKYSYLTYITIIAFFIFRIFYIATTEYNLVADEAYFWDWSRHPALSYHDMGPMVAWIIWFFTHIFPVSEFSVRIGAAVLAAMTVIVIYRLAVELTASYLLGFIVVLLFHVTPIGTAGGVIMTYYSPQVFFMSLTAFFLWRLVKENKAWWLYLIGLSLGLGILSHHMFIFFTGEVGLFLLVSATQRKWFQRKELYIAMVIELLAASPVFVWNLTHDIVMFRHAIGLMGKVHTFTSTLLKYIGGQAGVHTPLLFIAVIYGITVSGYRGIRFKDDKHLLLFSLSAPLIVFIAFLSIGGRTEANWPISAYVTGIISAVYVVYEKYKKGSPILKFIINASLVVTISISLFVSAIAYYPSLIDKLGYRLPPQQEPAGRLYGWKELGNEVSGVLAALPPGSFVAANEYGLAAQLAFYVDGHPEVYILAQRRYYSQYDFWNNFNVVKGKDAVFVKTGTIDRNIEALFDRVELSSHLINKTKYGDIRREFYLYKCYGYKGAKTEIVAF
ncbi:MAG: glycosyltransferase family 39 protein [Deltaproteobacteria bacterium]|nr:glycosyltransferase family 39 protein [Deltaproteobacteria bacterium]